MKYGTALTWKVALLALGLSSPALAVDGVLEINQACAVNTGCFSGDAAGLPVTIAATGSYRLTSNLIVAEENTPGITINIGTSDVSIDLNGFAISGPGECSGTGPGGCNAVWPTLLGYGIWAFGDGGHSVKNGSITGMGYTGVYLGYQAEVRNLRVRGNCACGIFAGSSSTVSGNVVHSNGEYGIFVTNNSTVSGNTVSSSGRDGIKADGISTISGNTANNNGTDGIEANGGSTISGNTVAGNGADGIHIPLGEAGSTISNNTAVSNGGHGIQAGSGSTVSGNTTAKNAGYGLNFVGTMSAYSGNVISGNTTGTVAPFSGASVQLGQNACNGNTICP